MGNKPLLAIFSLTSLLLSIVIAELVLREFFPLNLVNVYKWDAQLGHARTPSSQGEYRTGEFVTDLRFNQFGYRGSNIELNKKSGIIRIGVFGDSYVEAAQVDEESTMVKVLERRLNYQVNGHNIEVLNFGVSGYGTTQEMVSIMNNTVRFRLDAVLLMVLPANDIKNNSITLEEGVVDRESALRPYYIKTQDGLFQFIPPSPRMRDKTEQKSFLHNLRRHSAILTQTFNMLRQNESIIKLFSMLNMTSRSHIAYLPGIPTDYLVYNSNPDPVWQEAWDVTFKSLEDISNFCRTTNIRFFVGIIPNREQIYPEFWNEILHHYKEMRNVGSWGLDFPNQKLRVYFEKNNIDYFDMYPLFKEVARSKPLSDIYYPRDGHFTAQGQYIAGDAMAKFISKTADLS